MTAAPPEAAPLWREAVWPRPARAFATWLRPHLGLAALLALAALVNLWGLWRLGDANDFYAAAVKAGSESWKAFFYGSFDPANFITVDKPPASLWLMELSGRIFGFSTLSMLVPQALEGVAAVALLYATVRRWFDARAALLAGALLALTPVAALMFRYNNPDALLLLLLVASAYALTRALERASTGWLALAGAAIGFGFLTKMMEAFLVVPAFALVYLLAAPTRLRRRIGQLLISAAALVSAGGWWVAIVALVPAADRPYVGGSTDDSILNLIWNYNGVGRLEGGSGGGGFSGSPGPLRLFNAELGGQIGWLVPAAAALACAGLLATRRAARTDRTRAALLLWGGWLAVGALVFSFMSGIIHPYYTNILAPPIAVLVGVGAFALWTRRGQLLARVLAAAILAATSLVALVLLDRTPHWHPWLRALVLAAGLVAAALLLLAARLPRRVLPVLVALAAFAALGGPIAYTLETIASARSGSVVSAGPQVAAASPGARGSSARSGRNFPAGAGLTRPGFSGKASGAAPAAGARPTGAPTAGAAGQARGAARLPEAGAGGFAGGPGGAGQGSDATLDKLLAASPRSFTWVAATSSSQAAAPIELATGRAVMAIGGFTGSDPALTLSRFKTLVAEGKVHYYVASGGGGAPGGVSTAASQIAGWVAATFKAETVGGQTVYDLAAR